MPAPSIGVFLPSMTEPGRVPGDMAATARHAEDLGFESVWAVDQLVAGTGTPLIDSVVALAAAAAVTTRVRLGFGVMIVPLRPVVWIAKQVASLQHLSGDRVILGVGAGGDRHERSWLAAGVPRQERGRRTDAALRVLPDLIAGKEVRLDERADSPAVQLAPPAAVPPLVVGGNSAAAMARAVAYGDGWFALPVPPPSVAQARHELQTLATGAGRPTPSITASMMTVIDGDQAAPTPDVVVRKMTDPDGMFGLPPDQVDTFLVTGGPGVIAERLHAFAEIGVERVVVTLADGDWQRQAELLAAAHALLA